eukprot:m.43185 g.43185  ORF g.43185 m.43185 type:complete len:681 (-) comp10742_c0_seq2:331-2373(-)
MADPLPILKGMMTKRAQGKRKGGIKTWKDRYFLLTSTEFSYWDKDGGPNTPGATKKGSIGISSIALAEEVTDHSFDRLHLFQVVHGTAPQLTLYIQSRDETERKAWLTNLRALIASSPNRSRTYHPGLFESKGWTCCNSDSPDAKGCTATTLVVAPEEDLPPPPVSAPKPLHLLTPSNGSSSALPPPSPASSSVSSFAVPSSPAPTAAPAPVAAPAAAAAAASPTSTSAPAVPPSPFARVPSEPKKQVRVLFSYVAAQEDDLSMTKDEILTILEERPNWWRAQNRAGKIGFVPSNYVTTMERGIESEPWFHGKLSRAEASGQLQIAKQEGCFLIRESETAAGEYTLSVSHGEGVRHYRLQRNGAKYYVNESHQFESIPQLVEYHKLNAGGLVTRLRRCVQEAHAPVSAGLGYGVLELDRSEFSLGKVLGRGQFGQVQQGTHKTGRQVAIKMMLDGKMSQDEFISEALTMKDMTHPHLVQMLGVCTKDGPLWIVVELMSNGCLLDFMREHTELKKEPAIVHAMTVHIASAMEYLESKGFIHRDLAARNCLVGDNYWVKVADFGLARFVLDNEYTASVGAKFPIKWSAPEVVGYSRFSTKSDVWSFGVAMWEIWSFGQIPYAAHRNHEIADLLTSGYRMPRPVDAPVHVYQIILSCWHQDPENRPTFAELSSRLKENKEEYS